MAEKYRNGIITSGDASGDAEVAAASVEVEKNAAGTVARCREYMDAWKINDALREVWAFVRSLNKYIDVTAPWLLAKDDAKKDVLDAVLYPLFGAISGFITASLLAKQSTVPGQTS